MIQFENVSYLYGGGTPFEKKAVKNLSFTIYDNQVTGIIGHTGSGKSTLAQMMNALLKPTEGSVLYDGQDIWGKGYDTHKLRFKVGLVFQYPEYQLFEETVEKDIAFGPKNMGLSDEEIRKRVISAAKFTGISKDMLGMSPFDLSGGQKRRVAIAGIMAMEPDILVLDEPAAGLDPRGRNEILGGLCEYRKQKGNTLVIISHSMEDIARYSDRILALKDGRVLCEGTVKEVFSHSEEIKKSGLKLPQITEIMHLLKQKGLDISDSVYTVDDAEKEILNLLAKQRGITDRNA